MAAANSRVAWAVGQRGDEGVIEAWNGSTWQLQWIDSHAGTLTGVAAVSPTDAWAVGHRNNAELVLHWNGSTWRRTTTLPNTDPQAVTAAGRSSVWAIGGNADIYRRNGSQWQAVYQPPSGMSCISDYGSPSISAATPTDVWAVATCWENRVVRLVIHYDGTGFQTSELTDDNPGSFYDHVDATPTATWIADNDRVGNVVVPYGYQLTDTGFQGTRIDNYPTSHEAEGIAVVSPTNVWMVGSRWNAQGEQLALESHWDGTSWQDWGGPNPDGNEWLRAVAAIPGTDQLWAVGYGGSSGGNQSGLILHCCTG